MMGNLICSIQQISNTIVSYFKNKKKWKLKIYYLNQLVCTKSIQNIDDLSDIFNRPYVCTVYKKHLFKTFKTQVILIADRGLLKDENKKELHINCVIYGGVKLNEIQN